MLVKFWATVCYAGQTLNQYRVEILRLQADFKHRSKVLTTVHDGWLLVSFVSHRCLAMIITEASQSCILANKMSPNVGLMPVHRLGRWTGINPALGQHFLFSWLFLIIYVTWVLWICLAYTVYSTFYTGWWDLKNTRTTRFKVNS